MILRDYAILVCLVNRVGKIMKIHSIVGLLVVLCLASSSNAFLNSGGEDHAADGGIADLLT